MKTETESAVQEIGSFGPRSSRIRAASPRVVLSVRDNTDREVRLRVGKAAAVGRVRRKRRPELTGEIAERPVGIGAKPDRTWDLINSC